jgi:hypothetical protein
LLVSWCAGGRRDMAGSDKDRDRSRRSSAEDRGWSSTGRVLGGRAIGRLGDVVCGLHRPHGDEEQGFLVDPQNQGRGFLGLALKTSSSGLVIWASKSLHRFLGLGLKTKQATICRLCHKTDGRMIRHGTSVKIWWLALPRSKSHEGFLVWPQDWQRHNNGCCTWHHSGGCIERMKRV